VIVPGRADPHRSVPALAVRALRDAHEAGTTIAALCSGAFTLAAAGLLDGREATTHWRLLDDLAAAAPRARILRDVLFAQDGRVFTSAGVLGGADLCLQLVRQAHGADVAAALARRMVMPPAREGGQRQYVETPVPVRPTRTSVASTVDWAMTKLADHGPAGGPGGRALRPGHGGEPPPPAAHRAGRRSGRLPPDVQGSRIAACGTSVADMADYQHLLVERTGDAVRITMNRPARRNSLSADHLAELLTAFREAGSSDATGIVLAAEGPVFSAGHDFADVASRDLDGVRDLLELCTELMRTIQSVPQVVIARVHGLATAAGCQLVASCDLAVAAETAGFALPGGKGGWFCHTPAVPVARAISRKRLMEMALTGDVVDAATAEQWGLINRAVPAEQLDAAVDELLGRATRGSRASKALGRQTLYAQLDHPEADAYAMAVEVMAAASQTPGAKEGMAAFLGKRQPVWPD
jgi:enoyl-CoA hydratase/carnithine racemase